MEDQMKRITAVLMTFLLLVSAVLIKRAVTTEHPFTENYDENLQ